MGNREPEPLAYKQRITYSNQLIWLDPNISEDEFTELSKIFLVKKIETVEEYLDYIKQKWIYTEIPLICSGSLFESLEKQLKVHKEEAQKIKQIYIFCFDLERNKHYRNHQKVVCVTNVTEKLIEMIKKNNLSQIQLPSFRNFKDNDAKTIQLKYSYFLTFLTYPIQESKRSQLIMKCVNSINRTNISTGEDFEVNSYPPYFEPIQILELYSGNQFYNYINKILKVNTLARIEEAHILVHDLHQAIQQYSSFARRQSTPSVLFRGSILSLPQIEDLKKSIGSFIQTLGFLSTSIDLKVAANQQFRKNVIFKIYIPKFFKDKTFKNIKLRGGYIELNSLFVPKFPEEKEVLFNIKSVFVILRVQRKLLKIIFQYFCLI